MTDIVERAKEVLEWKRTGILPGTHLRVLAMSLVDKFGGSLDMGAALSMAEEETKREALELVIAKSVGGLPMTDNVDELLDFTTRDHDRGCTGREYVWSCGYDNDIEAAVKKAAAKIEHLRLSLSEARATGRREGMEEAWNMCERFIAGQKELQTKATEKRQRKEARDHETMKFAGVQLSAAIRAAMEKAE